MKNLMFKYPWLTKFFLNIWPPFLFSGIHITHLSADLKQARVELRTRPWNKNAVGTHFGGSLFAMTDPFYMLMILAQMGDEYIVWDKNADIDYLKPGIGVVHAEFAVSQSLIEEIKANTSEGDKYLPEIAVYIKDESGDVVAKVNRCVYVRRKNRFR